MNARPPSSASAGLNTASMPLPAGRRQACRICASRVLACGTPPSGALPVIDAARSGVVHTAPASTPPAPAVLRRAGGLPGGPARGRDGSWIGAAALADGTHGLGNIRGRGLHLVDATRPGPGAMLRTNVSQCEDRAAPVMRTSVPRVKIVGSCWLIGCCQTRRNTGGLERGRNPGDPQRDHEPARKGYRPGTSGGAPRSGHSRATAQSPARSRQVTRIAVGGRPRRVNCSACSPAAAW
jgi:hypothetical protein